MARASLVNQVELALKTLNMIGRSKKVRIAQGKKLDGIYFGLTMKNYINRCCTFAKWCKEQYGIKYLAEITPDMGRAYFQYLMIKNLSVYSMLSIRSSLKKLERGIKKTFHKSVHIIPKDMVLPKRSLANRQGRFAYTDDQVKDILKNAYIIDPRAAKALEIQYLQGARIFEVLNLRKQDIHFWRNVLVVYRGKGGRLREIPIDTQRAVELLQILCYGKEDKDILFPGYNRRELERVMEKACHEAGIDVHKTHNLRHSYAVKRYENIRTNGATDKEARQVVSQLLGHNRIDVVNSYVPRDIRQREY